MRTCDLWLRGPIAGAALGAKLAQTISARATATDARGIVTRLAGPYVARNLETVTATAVDASGTVMVTVLDRAAALGIGHAINEGVEFAERDSLEAGIDETLAME